MANQKQVGEGNLGASLRKLVVVLRGLGAWWGIAMKSPPIMKNWGAAFGLTGR